MLVCGLLEAVSSMVEYLYACGEEDGVRLECSRWSDQDREISRIRCGLA